MALSQLVEWLKTHANQLLTVDPGAPLDDLEPLVDVIGDARVVAIGESAHSVREFNLMRQRLLQFLNERRGFRVFAFEFGFSEAFALDPWVLGSGHEADLAEVSETASAWDAGELPRFPRRHNQGAAQPLRFAGIDIPEAVGSLLPALIPVADYFRVVDPDPLPLLEAAYMHTWLRRSRVFWWSQGPLCRRMVRSSELLTAGQGPIAWWRAARG